MRQQGKWLALSLLGVMVAVIALGWWLNGEAPAAAGSAGAGAISQGLVVAGNAGKVDVATRPDFVSDMEWQVLQGVAAQHAEPQKELARLLGKLEFSKRQEEWQQLNVQQQGAQDMARRQTLAAALLADIPARLKAGDMDKTAALKLQAELLADLVSDPAARAERVELEAGRLEAGVLQAQP